MEVEDSQVSAPGHARCTARASCMGCLMLLEVMQVLTVMPKTKRVSTLAPMLSQLSDTANLMHLKSDVSETVTILNQNVVIGVDGTLLTITISINFLKPINYPPLCTNDDTHVNVRLQGQQLLLTFLVLCCDMTYIFTMKHPSKVGH